jgi:hypothetical protein
MYIKTAESLLFFFIHSFWGKNSSGCQKIKLPDIKSKDRTILIEMYQKITTILFILPQASRFEDFGFLSCILHMYVLFLYNTKILFGFH